MKKIFANGGSSTTGWGCPNNENWTKYLAEKTKFTVENYAIDGSSIDRCVRFSINHLIENPNYDGIVIMIPTGFSRREFALYNNKNEIEFMNFMVSNIDSLQISSRTKKAIQYYYDSRISNSWSDYINGLKNIHHLVLFLESLNKPYIVSADFRLGFDQLFRSNKLYGPRNMEMIVEDLEITKEVYDYIITLEKELSKFMKIETGLFFEVPQEHFDHTSHPTAKGHEIWAEYIIDNFIRTKGLL